MSEVTAEHIRDLEANLRISRDRTAKIYSELTRKQGLRAKQIAKYKIGSHVRVKRHEGRWLITEVTLNGDGASVTYRLELYSEQLKTFYSTSKKLFQEHEIKGLWHQ